MKILLVNPSYKQDINRKYERYYIRSGSRWPHSGVKIKGSTPHYLPFPFILAYSASLLKEAGFGVYVIDAIALDIPEETLLERIGKIKPNLIFYEITTPTLSYDLLFAKKIKRVSNSRIIVGGTHATTYAHQILKENESIDFVLKGEYELPLFELARYLRQEDDNPPLSSVFRNKEEIIDKGHPSPIEPLDKLPFPLRDIFPANDSPDPTIYWDGFSQTRPAVQMQSSRGCPYRCYFCLWNQVIYNNGKYRTFSSKRVGDEMQELIAKYKAKELYFDDDDFTIDKEHILSICDEILKRKLKIKWSCMGDTINLTDEILGLMAKSGCIGIKFGVESGSERILKTIGKPVDLKKTREIIKICRKYGIKTQATFMIGLLEEIEEDIKKTIEFAKTLAVDVIQISIATPFPGTEFFRMAKEKGLLKNVAWQKYNGKISEVVELPNLNGRKIEKIRRKVFIIWFLKRLLSPFWCLRHIRIILRTLNGLGPVFFSKQFISVIIDEWKNREA
jgi:radical SAM superfamily enzyme YgiQ (UPF0313 family)